MRRYLDYVEGSGLYACLKRKGFEFNASAIQVPLVVEVGEPDIEQRQRVGYGLTVTPPAPVVDPTSTGRNDITADEATFGGPSDVVTFDTDGLAGEARVGGCRGEVLAKVYGEVATALDINTVQQEAHNRSVALMPGDQKEPVALRWSACMTAHGYSYSDQSAPKRELQAATTAAGSTEDGASRERQIAVVDGECTIDSGLVDLRRTAAAEYIASLSDAERTHLDKVVDQLNTSLAHAHAVLTDADHVLTG